MSVSVGLAAFRDTRIQNRRAHGAAVGVCVTALPDVAVDGRGVCVVGLVRDAVAEVSGCVISHGGVVVAWRKGGQDGAGIV